MNSLLFSSSHCSNNVLCVNQKKERFMETKVIFGMKQLGHEFSRENHPYKTESSKFRRLYKVWFEWLFSKHQNMFSLWSLTLKNCKTDANLKATQYIIRHGQANIKVVTGRLNVVWPADGQNMIRCQWVHREIIVTDQPPVSTETTQIQHK